MTGENFLAQTLETELRRASAKLNPLAWAEDYTVSIEEAEKFADPNFIIEGLIVQGHLHIIAAEPNGGKTTIFFHLSAEMVKEGFRVIYVNADVSAGDSKAFVRESIEKGIELLLPEMKAGKSMADIVANLRQQNALDDDLSRVVFVFDTLKKMADVINKSQSKGLLTTLRGLTGKGATIICLAHTNKYNGTDGKPVYEGTGDIRSDVDNLIYLIPEKNPDGSITVSVEPDKQRAALEKMTFRIAPDRTVTRLKEYLDVAAQKQQRIQREADQDAIERITEAIQAKQIKQSDILAYCKDHGISLRRGRTVLDRYSKHSNQIWKPIRGFEKNAIFYDLVE